MPRLPLVVVLKSNKTTKTTKNRSGSGLGFSGSPSPPMADPVEMAAMGQTFNVEKKRKSFACVQKEDDKMVHLQLPYNGTAKQKNSK